MYNDFQSVRVRKPWMRSSDYRYHADQSLENARRCVEWMGWNDGRDSRQERGISRNRILNVANRDIVKHAQKLIDRVKSNLVRSGIDVSGYKQGAKFEVIYLIAPVTVTNGKTPPFNDGIRPNFLDCEGIAVIKYLTLIDGRPMWDVSICVSMERNIGYIINDMYDVVREDDHRDEDTANLVIGSCIKKFMDNGYIFADDAYDAVTQPDNI